MPEERADGIVNEKSRNDSPTASDTEKLARMMRESLAEADRADDNGPEPDASDPALDDLTLRLKAVTERLAAKDAPAPVTEPEPVPEQALPDAESADVPSADVPSADVPSPDVPSADVPPEEERTSADGETVPAAEAESVPAAAAAAASAAEAEAASEEEPAAEAAAGGASAMPAPEDAAAPEEIPDDIIPPEDDLPNVSPAELPRGMERRAPKTTGGRPLSRFDPMQINLDSQLNRREFYLRSEPRPETGTRPVTTAEDSRDPAEETVPAAAAAASADTGRAVPTEAAVSPDGEPSGETGTPAAPAKARAPRKGRAPSADGSGAGKARPHVSDPVTDREAILERDTEMYLRLGYEDELRRSAADAARVEKVRHDRSARERVGTRNQIPAAYRGREYAGPGLTASVETDYRRAARSTLLRAICALIGVVCGIVYDCLPLMAGGNAALDDFVRSPLYPLGGLGLLVLICLPFIRRLALGLRSLWDFEPVRYAVPAASTGLYLVCLLVTCASSDPAAPAPHLFCGAASSILLAAASAELIAVRAEMRAFRVVSSGKARFVLTEDSLPGRVTGADRATDAPHASARKTLRAGRTLRLLDYFTWANRYNSRMSRLNYLLPAALLAAVLCGGLAVAAGGAPLSDGVAAFAAAYLVSLPASYLIAMSLPLLCVNRLLGERGCAVIGEAAPERYVPDSSGRRGAELLLPDGYVLSAESVVEVTLTGDPNARSRLLMAHRLFALMDSALITGVERPSDEELSAIRAELAEQGEGFLKLYMTDTRRGVTVEVMAGTHEALSVRGIRLPSKEKESGYRRTTDSRVLYVAFDRRFGFACACEYHLTGAFARAVHTLGEMDSTVSILSYDPLVTPSTLSPAWAKRLNPISLCRPDRIEGLFERRSGGVVATNQGLDLCWGYVACRRMKTSYRMAALWSWLWLLLSGGVMIGLAVAAQRISLTPLMPYLPLLVLAGETLSVGAAAAMTFTALRRERLDLEKH